MSKPKTKVDLLEKSQANYRKLTEFIDGLSMDEQMQDFPPGTLNRNIRDVLAHLHHWHLLALDWYSVGMAGEKPDMPAKGYSWKTTPALNLWIRDHYREIALSSVKRMLDESFHRIQKVIEAHSDDELFAKKRYQWTGSTSLGAYLISATSSHYVWAQKLIRKARKASVS